MGNETTTSTKQLTQGQFIDKVREIHTDRYDLSETIYTNSRSKVKVKCREHGEFEILARSLLSGRGCKQCGHSSTGAKNKNRRVPLVDASISFTTRTIQEEIDDFLLEESLIDSKINVIVLDLSPPTALPHRYYEHQINAARECGNRLIVVSPLEWLNKPLIVKSRLRHIFNKSQGSKHFARNLCVVEIPSAEAKAFYDRTHIQGGAYYKYNLGLKTKTGEVVAAMSFNRERFCKTSSKDSVELMRFSCTGTVVGGFSKLLSAFEKEHPEVTRIISYSDNRWSDGNVYKTNGFIEIGTTPVNYFFYDGSQVKNWMACQLHLLDGVEEGLSEKQILERQGFSKVYTACNLKWLKERA